MDTHDKLGLELVQAASGCDEPPPAEVRQDMLQLRFDHEMQIANAAWALRDARGDVAVSDALRGLRTAIKELLDARYGAL